MVVGLLSSELFFVYKPELFEAMTQMRSVCCGTMEGKKDPVGGEPQWP